MLSFCPRLLHSAVWLTQVAVTQGSSHAPGWVTPPRLARAPGHSTHCAGWPSILVGKNSSLVPGSRKWWPLCPQSRPANRWNRKSTAVYNKALEYRQRADPAARWCGGSAREDDEHHGWRVDNVEYEDNQTPPLTHLFHNHKENYPHWNINFLHIKYDGCCITSM